MLAAIAGMLLGILGIDAALVDYAIGFVIGSISCRLAEKKENVG